MSTDLLKLIAELRDKQHRLDEVIMILETLDRRRTARKPKSARLRRPRIATPVKQLAHAAGSSAGADDELR
jgi:uncharacterized protein HemY